MMLSERAFKVRIEKSTELELGYSVVDHKDNVIAYCNTGRRAQQVANALNFNANPRAYGYKLVD